MKSLAALSQLTRSAALCATLLAAGTSAFAQTFTPTDVFWAPSLAETDSPVNNQQRLLKVNAGGNFLTTTPTAVLPDRVYGQMGFKLDRTLAYLPSFFINRVLTVTPGGAVDTVTPFATGINRPTGMLVVPAGVHAGKLLCSSFGQDRILDISAGGDFTGAPSFATGTPSARNILQLMDGTLLVAASNGVRNITAGGASTSYASGFSGRDLVQTAQGTIYVTTSTGIVLNITGGGNFSAAPAFANGRVFIGLAINETGQLLASVSDNVTTLSAIYNITAGGDFSAAAAFATNLPGESETLLDTVPADPLVVTTSAATGVSGFAATLHGSVNPGGLPATASFDYGTSPTLVTFTTTTTTAIPSGNVAVPFSKVITGLTPFTTYYFRAKASTALSSASGAILTFTTGAPNLAPDAVNDSVHPPANLVSFTIGVLANDTDLEMDTLTVTGVAGGANGTPSVTGGGGSVTYVPTILTYTGNDTFTYDITDGNSPDTATVTLHNAAPVANNDSASLAGNAVTVNVLANDSDSDVGDSADFIVTAVTNGANGTVTNNGSSVTYNVTTPFFGTDTFGYTMTDGRGATSSATVLVSTLTTVITASNLPVSGEPVGTTYKKLGVPSIVNGSTVAFNATINLSTGGTQKVIVAGNPPTVLLRKGDSNTSIPGGLFASFKDPVINNLGNIAFLGSVSGVSGPSAKGLWSNMGGPLTLVARNASPAPDIVGVTLRSVKSVVITDSGVFFTGLLQLGGSVTGDNDVVLWFWDPINGAKVVLREGQSIVVGGTPKNVKSFKALVKASKSAGHGRAASGTEAVVHTTFIDKTQAILDASVLVTDVEVHSGGILLGVPVGAKWKTFGIPAINALDEYAFQGFLENGFGGITGLNNIGIFAGSGSSSLSLLAQKGDVPDGAPGTTFSSFTDPVFNDNSEVAFIAKLKATGLTSANNNGIWWGNTSGLDLVARAGSTAVGVANAWASFTSLALPRDIGPAFTAKLVLGGGIDKTNNFGLWAVDDTDTLHLLVRTGDMIAIGGPAKRVKTLTVLGNVGGTPTQGRAYSADSALIYRVTFDDGTQAILKVQFPTMMMF